MKRFPQQWRKGVSPGLIFAILLVILMVVLLAGCGQETATAPEHGTGTTASTTGASECAKCHMPEVATWQVSSHSQIDCKKCHTDANAAEMAVAPSGAVAIKEKVPGDTCKACHSVNRVFSLPGDLIVPHERHDKARVGCTDCHNTVVHYGITERNVLARKDFSDPTKWNKDLAEKIAQVPFERPTMWQCLDCHQKAKVDTPCKDCHTVYTSLPSHEQAAWLSIHGREGRKDVQGCAHCHASKEVGPKSVDSGTGDPIIDFERANSYCYNCHKTRPAFHGQDFMSQHATSAKTKGLLNCFACHSKKQPTTTENITQVYCNQCHWFQEVKSPAATQPAAKPAE